jgi:hypothetical protein
MRPAILRLLTIFLSCCAKLGIIPYNRQFAVFPVLFNSQEIKNVLLGLGNKY